MNEHPDLADKVAVVTGAGRGIGRTYAVTLAQAGARVVVADIDKSGAEETTSLIEDSGARAIAVHTDVTDAASTEQMASSTVAEFGRIDILVNNAAIWAGIEFEEIHEMDPATWMRILDVNLNGVFLASRAVLPTMMEQESGVIINQSSIGGFIGGPLLAHYCTSKGAVNALTRSIAKDYGDYGIRCNAIAPGIIANEATLSTVQEELLDMLEMGQGLKRRGSQDDLVGPLLFLASDASAFMTGQVVVIDGGGVMLG